jgi:hypothetical protein
MRFHVIVRLALVVVALAWGNGAMAQGRRVATVIGVSAYKHVPALLNTKNDASAIAAALQRLGFDVDLTLDPDKKALEDALRRLGQKAVGADVAVFYYAGHAVQVDGRNWLIPTSANPHAARDMPFEATDLNTVTDQTNDAARVTLLFLDSCRDNPFPTGHGGLGEQRAKVGTLVAYATAPGQVASDGNGGNSPFTAAMVRHIEEPGIEVRQLMSEVRRDVYNVTNTQQTPWDNSALVGNFYFNPAGQPQGGFTSAPPPQDPNGDLFWYSIVNSRDPADFEDYLARFPAGTYANVARRRIAELPRGRVAASRSGIGPGQAPPPPPPPGLLQQPGQQQQFAMNTAPPAQMLSPQEFHDALTARLDEVLPKLAVDARDKLVRDYAALRPHKALAGSQEAQSNWMNQGWSPVELARENVLEACQMFYGTPCVLLALDDQLGNNANDELAPVDMPRVTYDRFYDPNQIPAISRADRQRADIIAYTSAMGAKAAAIHPRGKIFLVTRAADSATAQTQALASCNADPGRYGAPCFVYAVENQVVLPKRATAPITGGATTTPSASAPPASAPPALAPPALAPSQPATGDAGRFGGAPVQAAVHQALAQPRAQTPQTLRPPVGATLASPRDALLAKMGDLASRMPPQIRESRVRDYLDRGSPHKALLVSLAPAGIWTITGAADVGLAEEGGFERCQAFFGAPCVEVALDGDVKIDATAADARDMPRVAYAGTFDPGQIPGLSDADRARADVVGYAAVTGFKASAFHPLDGKIFVAVGGGGARAAQQKALAACKADPVRGDNATCFLYSVGNDVVLPQRRTDPL